MLMNDAKATIVVAVLFIILWSGVIASCAQSTEQTGPSDYSMSTRYGYTVTLRYFRLKDGTRCAALLGKTEGSLSCDWQHTTSTN